ncbi:DUF3592 domain-containing protein [Archangium sp.]|uniref:DUF3592 domain-containing protein n=1 Tax=Archangium sp. TaxID=1872627 RepID=UPI00286C173F|nr:DUF3592 domain-containing protein [Archangium sp.]
MSALGRIPLPFLLLWSALTLGFDGVILHGLTRQLQSMSYSRTTGTITHSTVTESSDSDGTTYGFDVRYLYEVNGQRYQGNHYRYNQWSASNRSVAKALEQRFPLGATVPVFHDPEAPDDAVLFTGVQGFDLFMLMFMGPFNLVMLGGWAGVLSRRRRDEVGAFMRNGRWHVRLEKTGAVATGFMTLGLSCFMAVFIVGFPTSFHPSLPTALLTWGAIIVISVLSARRHGAKLEAGDNDLIVDEGTRRLSLPVGPDRTQRLDIPWNQVCSVSVETHTTKDSDGDTQTTWRPTVMLTFANGTSRGEAIADWNDEQRATALVEWLKSRLHGAPRVSGPSKLSPSHSA